jgi:hypothetical protein
MVERYNVVLGDVKYYLAVYVWMRNTNLFSER